MLQMGDEGHNRNRAGSLMLLRELLPGMITADASSADVAEAVRFSGANEHFFLNLGMPACKLAHPGGRGHPRLDASSRRWRATAPTSASGCPAPATQWFTGPANTPEGLFLGDYGPDDANPDIGDSAITETGGIGGFAMAAAPAIVRFVGGDVPFALRATRTMYEITIGEHPAYQVPILEFRGTPDRHRRHQGGAHRHPAADQHRHGRAGRGHRPGRRRAGHPAGGVLPGGPGRPRRSPPRLTSTFSPDPGTFTSAPRRFRCRGEAPGAKQAGCRAAASAARLALGSPSRQP